MSPGTAVPGSRPRLLFVVTEDWYFRSHRLPLAEAARREGFEIALASRFGEDRALLEGAGFALHPIDLGRGRIDPLRDLRSVFRLWRLYRRVRPDIVHQVAMKPVVLGTLAARAAGVPAVLNAIAGLGYAFSGASDRPGRLRQVLTAALRLALRWKRSMVVVQNDDDRRFVESLGVRRKSIAVIRGSGVDVEALRPVPEPAGPCVATLVARMLWDKGVGDLVEAARQLRAMGVPVRVRLVGAPDPDNPASIPQARLEAWQVEGAVEWSGPTADIAAVWAGSHVAVLPSYREGLPKALLEAAACGRPLVATDVPGCRELVEDGVTGLLVPPRDPAALAEALARLAGDPVLRARLGAAARERVVERHSLARVVEETLAVYRRLCPAVGR
jgi:glycosyltransferase involved in cell wall biosynthesis